MPNIATELVIARNEFYQRCYDQIKLIVVILMLITALLIGFAIRQNKILQPTPKYFPTTPDGRLIYDPPVDINHLILSQQKVDPTTDIIIGMPQPTMTYTNLQAFGEDALILFWAYTAVTEMFDYDYVHYRSVIQESSKYFTPTGHQNFIDALISSKNLETVKARSAVVIPEITGQLELQGTDYHNGRYAWHIQIPIKLTYASAQDVTPIVQRLKAMVAVERVSTLQCPFYGLAIYKLNFTEVTDNQGT